MSQTVEVRIKQLPGEPRPALLALWNELFKGSPPKQVRKEVLIKFLAYRIQEQAYGGLSPFARKRLTELARQLENNPNAELSGAPRIKPGTRLVRDWRGKSHCVTVLQGGYEYAGKHFASLSQIARLITGTRWSGPLFFGLRNGHARTYKNAQRS